MKIQYNGRGTWIVLALVCLLRYSTSETCSEYSLDFIDPDSTHPFFCSQSDGKDTPDAEDLTTTASPDPPTKAPTTPGYKSLSPQVVSLRATVAYLTTSCLSQALYLRWRLQNKYPTIKPPCTSPCLYRARPEGYQHTTKNFTAKIQEDYWTANNYVKFYLSPNTGRVVSHAGIDRTALQDLITKTQSLRDRMGSLLVALGANPYAQPTWTPSSNCYKTNLRSMLIALDNMEDFLRDYIPTDINGLGF